MSESRLKDLFLDTKGLSLEELEAFGTDFLFYQAGVNWWIGDVARYAEARFPDTNEQVFPACVSPGLIARCKAVAQAYPREEDRNPLASWSIHMQNAGRPDRIAGHTSDEAREADKQERSAQEPHGNRWILCIDCNYFLHRFWHSGAGVEAAGQVASWVGRTVERLKAKGLTDVACCFDSHTNNRKELTKEWEDKYKDRPPKDPELGQQLNLVRDLLGKANFCCVSVEGYEADDVLASFAKQFDGKVTLLTQDKDIKQCLSAKANMLLDVTWKEDDTSGEGASGS